MHKYVNELRLEKVAETPTAGIKSLIRLRISVKNGTRYLLVLNISQ